MTLFIKLKQAYWVLFACWMIPVNLYAEQLMVKSSDTVTPVIELYTSEGCSSCPRADDFLTDLGKTIDPGFHAVPLAFHVDYWNYLGWQDPYSQAQFTQRQRWIGQLNGQATIYTPQLVVSGKETRGGHKVVESVERANATPARVDIQLNIDSRSGLIIANIDVDNRVGDSAKMHVALFENNITRQIKGGENSGRTLLHNHVVRHWSEPFFLDQGYTKKSLELELNRDWDLENLGMAVIVSDSVSGHTLQSVSTPVLPADNV